MGFILDEICNGLNSPIGFGTTLMTYYDRFKNQDHSHIEETFTAIRNKSKEAYDLYCKYCIYSKDRLGKPLEEDILGYWKSCLKRDRLPSVDDMVSLNIADKAEAEIMLQYLLKSWMEIPDFVGWLHSVLTLKKLDKLDKLLDILDDIQKSSHDIAKTIKELNQQNVGILIKVISPNEIINEKYSCTERDINEYYKVNNTYNTMFRVICKEEDVPHVSAYQKVMELMEQGDPIIIAGNGGLGKTSLMMRAAVQWASSGRLAVWLSLSSSSEITQEKADSFLNSLIDYIPSEQRVLLCIDNPFEGKISFSNLKSVWFNNQNIQLIMAERSNRLTLLADSDQDLLLF